jgi:hypothetical protein
MQRFLLQSRMASMASLEQFPTREGIFPTDCWHDSTNGDSMASGNKFKNLSLDRRAKICSTDERPGLATSA